MSNFNGWKNAYEVLLGKPLGKATDKAKQEAEKELKKAIGINKNQENLWSQFLREVIGGPWEKD